MKKFIEKYGFVVSLFILIAFWIIGLTSKNVFLLGITTFFILFFLFYPE